MAEIVDKIYIKGTEAELGAKASNVSVLDTGANYNGEDLETVLAEIASQLLTPSTVPTGFIARNSNTQTLAATFTDVVFITEEFDSDDAFDGTAFTVPAGEGGIYEITGHATFTSITDGNIAIVGVTVNNNLSNGGLLGRGTAGGTGLSGFGGSLRLVLSAGDVIRMQAYSQNTTTLYNTSQTGYTHFSAIKIGTTS